MHRLAQQALLLASLAVLSLPAVVQAQFILSTNNGQITIAKYTGSNGVVCIPSTTNGLPGTTGWSNSFGGRPTAIWNPQTNGVAQGKNLFKQQSYAAALNVLGSVIEDDTAPSEIQAEALYWKVETLFAQGDLTNAYRTAKHLVWNYPSTKWAGRYMHHLPEPKEKQATQSPPQD